VDRRLGSPNRSIDASAGALHHRSVTSSETPKLRVLVVDDAPCFREAACQLLKARGYAVAGEAECAAAALRAVAELAPDAVLLDVHLPDGNGLELAADLVRANPELAVLLVSVNQVDEEVCRDGPARGFVAKSQLAKVDLAKFWPPPETTSAILAL